MNLCYLLEMIDYLNELDDLLSICLEEWDKRKVIDELAYFRKHGKLSGEYMGCDVRGVFRLLLHELKEQIKEADPQWFEAYILKREDREHEARIVDAMLKEQAEAEEEAEDEGQYA